jgi:hypothetical protein
VHRACLSTDDPHLDANVVAQRMIRIVDRKLEAAIVDKAAASRSALPLPTPRIRPGRLRTATMACPPAVLAADRIDSA